MRTTNELGYTYNEVMIHIANNLEANYRKLHGQQQNKSRKPKSNAYRIDRGDAQMRHR
jgi:hypothetical protein